MRIKYDPNFRVPKPVCTENNLTFEQGYIYAVVLLIKLHGGCVEANDLLREYGRVDWSKIPKQDQELFVSVGLLKKNCFHCGKLVPQSSWTTGTSSHPTCSKCAEDLA